MVWKIPLCCTVHPRGVQMQILCRFVSLIEQEDGYPVKYAVFFPIHPIHPIQHRFWGEIKDFYYRYCRGIFAICIFEICIASLRQVA